MDLLPDQGILKDWAALVGVVIVVYWVVTRFLRCPEVFGREKYKRGRREVDSFKRRQLDRFRAESGHFPKPYPDGWYKAADSCEVPKGKVEALSALGREFVIFRGNDGQAAVIDAFCPHLGTHLGHGGQVVGNNIQCPYHLWEFDTDGINKNIPYCKKDMSHSSRVNVRKYHTYESKELGAIFFWFDAQNGEPRWPLHPGLKEVEQDIRTGRMRRVCTNRWDDMLMHVFEPSQNSADYFHFQTVHQFLPMPFNLKLVKADHKIETVYGREGGELPEDCMLIRERLDKLKVFGIDAFTLPKFIGDSIVTYVFIQGPNNVVFKVDTIFGRFRAHFALMPLEPFRQKATLTMYADNSIPYPMARLLHWWIEETVGQDRQVWEHKVHVAPRNLVAGDGPFAQYGRWLQHFYSETSYSWEQVLAGKSLSW